MNRQINENPREFILNESEESIFSNLKRIDSNGKIYSMDYDYDYELDLVLNSDIATASDLLKYASKRLIKPELLQALMRQIGGGCSSFTVDYEDSLLYGRNFDYELDNVPVIVVHTAPKNGYKSICLSDIGGFGFKPGSIDDKKTDISLLAITPFLVVDGINEKGLTVCAMVLDEDPTCQNTGKNKIMTTVAMRLVLDRAKSTDEAIELLKQFDMQSPSAPYDFHFLIADENKNTRVVEYVNNKINVLDFRYSTNFYLTEGDLYRKGHGFDRFETLRKKLTEKNFSMNKDEVFSLLKDISQHGDGNLHSYTVWSSLYDIKKRTLQLVASRNFNEIYEFFV